jgi:kumamolisin
MTPKKKLAGLTTEPRMILAGSQKPRFHEVTEKPASGRVTVSVILRRKAPLNPRAVTTQRLTRAEYARTYAADKSDLAKVRRFADAFGLKVQSESRERRTIVLTGSVTAMQKAFGVQLKLATVNDTTYRVREGEIQLPASLAGIVIAVLGLDNRPQAKPHFRVLKGSAARASAALPATRATNTSFTPVQVAQLYQFPTTSAAGQTIGIIELGGGFRTADISAYFKSLSQTPPTVIAVSVDSGKNSPSDPNGADGEVMLDIEVAGAVAPGAKIVVYFAPNTDQGFIDAISTAVHDTTHKPSVISISWGGPESSWTQQSMTALDQACQSAAALGITITAASGDNGSSDGVTTGGAHVDFPASSPHVLACGGTKLLGSAASITSEVVWNESAANEGATGGGVSATFPLPTWQANAGVPKAGTFAGRGVPDVSGDADPVTGYIVRVDGQSMVIGGTSAVAPLWAGLIALANAQNKATAGFLQPTIYSGKAKTAFRDVTSGDNGAFKAAPGWDACTGLGSPNGAALAQLLAGATTTKKPTKKPTSKAAKKKSAKR